MQRNGTLEERERMLLLLFVNGMLPTIMKNERINIFSSNNFFVFVYE